MATQAKEVEGVERRGRGSELTLSSRAFNAAMKDRICILFAQFQSVSAIKQAMRDEFGLECQGWDIITHDPGRSYFRGAKRLRELYAITRKKFVEDLSEVGIAHQSYRLRSLERMARTAELQGQLSLSAQLLKQAAEETGGVFTNVTKVKHSGTVAAVHLSVDDAKRELAMRLAGMVEDRALLPPPDEGTKDS